MDFEKKNIFNTEQPPLKCPNCAYDDDVESVEVCDNSNQTHQSICLFAQWNCERRLRLQEERILIHIGKCHSNSPIFSLIV